jgi:hypothetical protein
MRIPIAVLLCVLSCTTDAWAHGEEPLSETIHNVPSGWILKANMGVVQSTNPRELICEEAFLGGVGWSLGVLGETEWLTFGESSVMRTEDGCQFDQILPLEKRPSDATVHAESGGAAFVMNGVDGGTGLFLSTDRGLTFELVETFDVANEQTTGVRYLDGETLLVSGYNRNDAGAGLLWSVEVATGTATRLQVPDGVSYPYVLAANGGRLLLLGRRGEQTVFWGTPDNVGQLELVADTWPSWAELSADGNPALISGMIDGKSVARGSFEGAAATWETLAPETTAGCVAAVSDDVFVCGLARIDGFDVQRITPAGAIEGVLDFREFDGIRSDCPADSSVATVCPLVWKEIAPYFGIDPNPGADAGADIGGTSDAGSKSGSDVPTTTTPRPPRDEGCCATTAGGSGSSGLFLLLALLIWRRRP